MPDIPSGPCLSLPCDFLNKYPHLTDILRGKGLPDICSEEWIAIVSYFDSGKAIRGDRILFANYLKANQKSFNIRLDRDLKGRHNGRVPESAKINQKRQKKNGGHGGDGAEVGTPFQALITASGGAVNGVRAGYPDATDGARRCTTVRRPLL